MTHPETIAELTQQLDAQLSDDAKAWFDQTKAAVAQDPTKIRSRFPAVGRKVGRGPLDGKTAIAPGAAQVTDGDEDFFAWTVDDAARTLLLDALGDAVLEELQGLYRHGDAAEKRGVLRALPLLNIGEAGVQIVDDGLRTNDLRLIAAALGPYAIEHLDDHAISHAALKCVFVDLPLSKFEGLAGRTTPELSRMLGAYAHERVAAGRPISKDVWPIVNLYPPKAELAAIEAETEHQVEDRRRAAEAALTDQAAAAN